MNKKRLYLGWGVFVLFSLLLGGCKEFEMLEYKNAPALYFNRIARVQMDSISQSFYFKQGNVERDTVYLIVSTMGLPVNYDRNISIKQVNATNPLAAVPNVHYIPFDSPEMTHLHKIHANKVTDSIPVILLNNPSLSLGQYRLELTIQTNEYFQPGVVEMQNLLLKTTAMGVKPVNWESSWRVTFGDWGSVKMKLIIDATGITDFVNARPNDPTAMAYMKALAVIKLDEYNTAHLDAPLREATGELVVFP